MHSFADLRGERASEVLAQAVPQTANWSAIAGLTPDRHEYTWQLLGVGLRFAMMNVMRFKRALGCPRPMEYSALVQPMILTPGYTAFPSGHATESYFVAEFLPLLVAHAAGLMLDQQQPKEDFRALAKNVVTRDAELASRQGSLRAQLHRIAYRIAENRVVAGLHFPIDGVAGQLLGVTLARYVAARCGLGGSSSVGCVGHGFVPNYSSVAPVEPLLDTGIDVAAKWRTIQVGTTVLLRAADPGSVLVQLAELARQEW